MKIPRSRAGGPRRRVLGAAAAALLTLAGCGLTGAPPHVHGHADNAIDVWFPGTDQTEIDLVTKTIVPRFERETGAKVHVTYLDWSNISTKLNAAFAAGTAPDVFGHGPAAVADFVSNDRLEPLTRYVARMSAADRADMATALPSGQVDGVQYLMPIAMQGTMIGYRAADFEAAGLDPDQPPATWAGVLADARRLTEHSKGRISRAGLLLPTHPIGLQQTFAGLLASDGGRQISADGRKAVFDSPAGVRALSYFVQTYQGPDPVGDQLGADWQDGPTAQQPLVTGDAAMTMLTSQAAEQIQQAHPDLGLRIMPLPAFPGHQGAALGGAGTGLMINRDSPDKALAWKFISYMLSAKTSLEYTEGIGALPLRASARNDPSVTGSPVVKAYVKELDHFVPNPNVPGWVQIRDTLSKYLEQALNGKLSPKHALDQAADEADGFLAASR